MDMILIPLILRKYKEYHKKSDILLNVALTSETKLTIYSIQWAKYWILYIQKDKV